MTYATQSKAFQTFHPFLKTFDLWGQMSRWQSPSGTLLTSETSGLSSFFLHCLLRVYLNFTPTYLSPPWWHAVLLPFPSLLQRMAASVAVPREPPEASGRIPRGIWKAPDMFQVQQSGKIWMENMGKQWKTYTVPKRNPLQRSHHKFTRPSPAIRTVLLRVPAWN